HERRPRRALPCSSKFWVPFDDRGRAVAAACVQRSSDEPMTACESATRIESERAVARRRDRLALATAAIETGARGPRRSEAPTADSLGPRGNRAHAATR